MQSTELGRNFLTKVSEYLVSLPFDLKILQEAIAEPDLEHEVRELAAGVLINALNLQEGASPERYVDDILFLRIALGRILQRAQGNSDGAAAFCARFEEVFHTTDSDLKLLQAYLGPELWSWLCGRLSALARCTLKGKRPTQYLEDEGSWDGLYEDGLDFQTNYDVTEEKVQNRLRRPEQIVEWLQKRRAEDSKKRG
jgi:hypothetical protein